MSRELVFKKQPLKQIVVGEVYAPQRPDSDGEFMTAETIEKMAYNFLRNNRNGQIDMEHNNKVVKGASVVESFIAREGDPDFIPGSWVIAVHIPDPEVWALVEKGEINGFSLEALVEKKPQQREIDMPPQIVGKTSKESEHEHQFFVNYDNQGRFLGGKTDTVDGHFHLIKSGTLTEPSNGHTHLFCSVEDVKIV